MTLTKLLDYLPRGSALDEAVWHKRHRFLLIILALHMPVILGFGLFLGHPLLTALSATIPVAGCVLIGATAQKRRVASFFVTAGLVYTAVAFTVLSHGTIEAHFHFFVIIGLIALYQDWVPFMWNIVLTVFSHGLGSAWQSELIFNHPAAQQNPWLWTVIHGSAVVAACIGVVVFWRETENAQQQTLSLAKKLADQEIIQRKFTSELLVNLARRNQSMLYRQLDIINQLEEKENDPDALGELFRLDHLATRIRRNAESLLVLSGEEPTRVWSEPVRLIDVVRAAIAETEDLDRVAFAVDERMEVHGHTVTDLTHVLAELTENAVRFSPPEANVTIRTRPYLRMPGAAVLTVEDWGVGMRAEDMAAANDLLAHPRDVDLSVSQRLGLHVVARLAARHNIQASLTPTPGTGVTAVVVLPAELFASNPQKLGPDRLTPVGVGPRSAASATPGPEVPTPGPEVPMPRRAPSTRATGNGRRGLHARPDYDDHPDWTGWWTPNRVSAAHGSSWQAPPIYATAEPLRTPTASGSGPLVAPAAALPAAPPEPAQASGPAETPGPDPLLIRRVPQASLAPELRRSASNPESVPEPSPPADREEAREALSRFQASRQAAQQQVGPEGGNTSNGSGRHS
jgi:signal transduction histidine kinase